MIKSSISLSVLLINWNNTEDIISHLARFSRWSSLNPSVIIVDNNSASDPSVQIKSLFPDTIVIRSPENRGFSGGNNLGLQYCLEYNIDYILLLNHDAEISEEIVDTLINLMQSNPQIGAAGPLIREGNRIYAGGRDISKHPSTRILFDPTLPLIREVTYLSGTALLLQGETLKKSGLFDERYFFSGEVADLCSRINKCGYTCMIHTGLLVNHYIEHDTPMRERIHLYYSFRNRFLYMRKERDKSIFLWIAFWLVFGFIHAILSIIYNKPHSARAIILALFDGIRGSFGNKNEYFIH